jgi:hypothetical protein
MGAVRVGMLGSGLIGEFHTLGHRTAQPAAAGAVAAAVPAVRS